MPNIKRIANAKQTVRRPALQFLIFIFYSYACCFDIIK